MRIKNFIEFISRKYGDNIGDLINNLIFYGDNKKVDKIISNLEREYMRIKKEENKKELEIIREKFLLVFNNSKNKRLKINDSL